MLPDMAIAFLNNIQISKGKLLTLIGLNKFVSCNINIKIKSSYIAAANNWNIQGVTKVFMKKEIKICFGAKILCNLCITFNNMNFW